MRFLVYNVKGLNNMKRKYLKMLIILNMIILIPVINSYDLNGEYSFIRNTKGPPFNPMTWVFDDNRFHVFGEDGYEEIDSEGTYRIIKEEIFHWIEIEIEKYEYKVLGGSNIAFEEGPLAGKRLLLLYSDEMLYMQNPLNKRIFSLGRVNDKSIVLWSRNNGDIRESTFLIEGEIEYNAENLRYLNLNLHNKYIGKVPWVEGVNGYGVNEWVELGFTTPYYIYENNRYLRPVDHLVIFNGYIDASRPDLYLKNGRIKKIRITSPNYEELDQIIEIRDIPDPQIFKIDINNFGNKVLKPFENTVLHFEIMDIYPGIKWEDTCVSMIAGVNKMKILEE